MEGGGLVDNKGARGAEERGFEEEVVVVVVVVGQSWYELIRLLPILLDVLEVLVYSPDILMGVHNPPLLLFI